ncbi:MAG: hypothetical protein MZV49_00285 [Rhodopseudomonas palustris]|nr:hypothetical protein [Rhodopseudomonas palustris]
MEYRSIRAEGKEFPYRWPLYFLTASSVWNFVGAGMFGFLINLPDHQLLRARHLPDQQPRPHGPLRGLRHAGHRR